MIAGLAAWWLVAGQQQPDGAAGGNEAKNTAANQRTFTSGQGLFSVTFPAGWTGILRVLDSDRFVITGSDQPSDAEGLPVGITDASSFDGKGPAVLNIEAGQGFPPPQGIATDLLVGSGQQLLSGRKYVYVYELDGSDALGIDRKRNERDYTYVFPLGGERELRVAYSVYAADRHDQSVIVDEVVRSIRKLK